MSRTPTALHLLGDLLSLMDEGEGAEARSVNIEEKKVGLGETPEECRQLGTPAEQPK